MPLDPNRLQAAMASAIHAGLAANFTPADSTATGYPAIADPFWVLLANAIATAAIPIVVEIVTNALVVATVTPTSAPVTGKVT